MSSVSGRRETDGRREQDALAALEDNDGENEVDDQHADDDERDPETFHGSILAATAGWR